MRRKIVGLGMLEHTGLGLGRRLGRRESVHEGVEEGGRSRLGLLRLSSPVRCWGCLAVVSPLFLSSGLQTTLIVILFGLFIFHFFYFWTIIY